jgi:hypothetical protein
MCAGILVPMATRNRSEGPWHTAIVFRKPSGTQFECFLILELGIQQGVVGAMRRLLLLGISTERLRRSGLDVAEFGDLLQENLTLLLEI